MPDVRSMLRSERAARRVNHPYASYSSSGLLSCSVCKISMKSETFWDSHLRSPGHAMRISQQKAAQLSGVQLEANGTSKKRKLEEESHGDPTTKKARNTNDVSTALADAESESAPHNPAEAEISRDSNDQALTEQIITPSPNPGEAPSSAQEQANVDEDEWAAFEREIAATERQVTKGPALQSAPTISAKPMTAQEVSAQAQDERSLQKSNRETELEEEREEAARQAEDELDHMNQLDERMKVWRQRQEALRSMRGTGTTKQPTLHHPHTEGSSGENHVYAAKETEQSAVQDVDSEADDDDDDDWDPWRGLGGGAT
ncbi:MAG: hypothetical protein M1828_003913 [Chrysothrix sp. TS-e1954]|nr:MAG: hypothetical protein M1828_003913 [Chrysothrix sp. TS-e1954]